MKTTTYLLTVLAIAIQVMVYGQTSGSRTHKVRMDIMGMPKPAATAPACASPELPTLSVLMEQANSLAITAQKLKEEAKKAETQLVLKQIEVSTLMASFHYKKFDENRLVIAPMLDKLVEGTYLYTKARGLDNQACYFIKTAREMREEADAQLTNEARYGNMTNAEVYEKLALDKQEEVISLLSQSDLSELPMKEAIVNMEENKTGEELRRPVDVSLTEALAQANDLKNTARRLREEAVTKGSYEKNMMLAEAKSMEKEYILKEVEASELSGKMNQEVFCRNRLLIAALLDHAKDDGSLLSKAKIMNSQAEHFLKMGIEMREEANAQLTPAARYGDMSNAEEEELLALDTQQQILSFLGQASPGIALK